MDNTNQDLVSKYLQLFAKEMTAENIKKEGKLINRFIKRQQETSYEKLYCIHQQNKEEAKKFFDQIQDNKVDFSLVMQFIKNSNYDVDSVHFLQQALHKINSIQISNNIQFAYNKYPILIYQIIKFRLNNQKLLINNQDNVDIQIIIKEILKERAEKNQKPIIIQDDVDVKDDDHVKADKEDNNDKDNIDILD